MISFGVVLPVGVAMTVGGWLLAANRDWDGIGGLLISLGAPCILIGGLWWLS